MKNEAEDKERLVYASLNAQNSLKKRMVRTPSWKYIFNDNSSRMGKLFRIERDGLEQNNLIDRHGLELNRLVGLIEAHISECTKTFKDRYSKGRKSTKEIPQKDNLKQLEILKALGYVN
jgi:hypothetical protein